MVGKWNTRVIFEKWYNLFHSPDSVLSWCVSSILTYSFVFKLCRSKKVKIPSIPSTFISCLFSSSPDFLANCQRLAKELEITIDLGREHLKLPTLHVKATTINFTLKLQYWRYMFNYFWSIAIVDMDECCVLWKKTNRRGKEDHIAA